MVHIISIASNHQILAVTFDRRDVERKVYFEFYSDP